MRERHLVSCPQFSYYWSIFLKDFFDWWKILGRDVSIRDRDVIFRGKKKKEKWVWMMTSSVILFLIFRRRETSHLKGADFFSEVLT